MTGDGLNQTAFDSRDFAPVFDQCDGHKLDTSKGRIFFGVI